MPVYNGAVYLREAIDSILAQTYPHFELLVIDDGSLDDSADIIRSYSDNRIRLISNERNSGIIFTLNRGIAEAKGKYIARMDADDVSYPMRFEKQVMELERHPGLSVLATFVDFINSDGEITSTWFTDRSAVTETQIRNLMMRTNCIAHPTVMMRADVAREFRYNEKQKGAEDWDLWMRLLAAGKRISKIPEVLVNYRIHPGSITGKDKAADVLEVRLIRTKMKFLLSQVRSLRVNSFYFSVKLSMLKNMARHLLSNKLPHWGRDIKRYLTSAPWTVSSQGKAFREALEKFQGRHVLIFPYMHVGGAEKVHAAIAEAIGDQRPLVIFSSFSDNSSFRSRFEEHATVLDVAHYINYPLTRRTALRLLSEKLNSTQRSVVLGSNAGFFYDIIPWLRPHVRVADIIHAFKYQPEANLAHRRLLPLAARINARIFVSEAARKEFDTFCFHHSIPRSIRERLRVITNGVHIPEQLHTPEEPKGILFVGRDSPEKRLHIFYRIAHHFHNQKAGLRFTVVGTDSNVTYPFISFAGEVNNDHALEMIYQDHHFLLVTSEREGFPVVIMEAMANGLIVIATPVGDIPNRLNGKNGIVLFSADEKNVVEETIALLNELMNAPERMEELRREARRFAEEHFSMEQFRINYRHLLQVD
jgi:glycosyltransferase involved in cell wall biosynthesis